MSRTTLVRWRFFCDQPGCMVSSIIGENDRVPHGWVNSDGKHYCQHHAEDAMATTSTQNSKRVDGAETFNPAPGGCRWHSSKRA